MNGALGIIGSQCSAASVVSHKLYMMCDKFSCSTRVESSFCVYLLANRGQLPHS